MQIKMHFIYEYSTNPMIGTWTLQREREVMSRNREGYNKVAYDNTGMFFGYASANVGNNISWSWWNWENDSVTSLSVTGDSLVWATGGNTLLPKNSNRPYTTGDISDNGTFLQLEFRDYKNWDESIIELTSFPLTEYKTWKYDDGDRNKGTMMMDGYLVTALVNKTTDRYEFWKFDLFGQATKIADGLDLGVYDAYGTGNNRYNIARAGDYSSPTIGFKLAEDTNLNHDNSFATHRLYWIDTSA